MVLALIPAPNTPVAEIRYELTDNHIYVKSTVNGRGPYWFIFDTGASATVIHVGRAKQLELVSKGSVPAGGAGAAQRMADVHPAVRLKVGDAPESEQTVYGISLDMVAQADGRAVDGVVGYDYFGKYVVEFDYAGSTIRLYRPEGYRYEGSGETLPFNLVMNHIRVKASVVQPGHAPVEGTFTIDTGASNAMAMTKTFVKNGNLLTTKQKALPIVPYGGGVGGKVMGRVSRIQELRLGNCTLERPVANFSEDETGYFASPDLAGIIGNNILKRFKVIVNYPRKEITFEKNGRFAGPDATGASGFRLEAQLPDLRSVVVRDIWPDGPAARAGVKEGDVLVQVNGHPAEHYSMEDLRTLARTAGSRISLMLKRGIETVRADYVVATIE